MAEPTYKLELGLAAKPLDALSTVVWTDVTDVGSSGGLAWSVSQGRSTEREDMRAGTLTVVMDNADGTFDPLNSSSPYYPSLKPMCRIRLTAEHDAITYPLFVGYVDNIKVDRLNEHYSTVTIQATDAFKLFNLLTLRDPYETAVLNIGPRAFYRFQESASGEAQVELRDASGNHRPGLLANPKRRLPVVDPGDPDTSVGDAEVGFELADHGSAPSGRAVHFHNETIAFGEVSEATNAGFGRCADVGVAGTADFAISFMVNRGWNSDYMPELNILSQCENKAFSDPGDNLVVSDELFTGDILGLRVRVLRAGASLLNLGVTLGHFEGSTFIYAKRGQAALDHVLVVRQGAEFTITVWPGINPDQGAFFVSGTASATPNLSSQRLWLATADANSFRAGFFYGFIGYLAEVAYYPVVPTGAQVLALHQSIRNWVGHLPGQRLTAVHEQLGWDASDTDFEAGITVLQAFDGTGKSATAHFLEVAKADDGIYFIAPDGKATFYGRRHLLSATRSTVVQATFGDGGGAEIPYIASGLDPTVEESALYNEVVAQRTGGVPQIATDATSVEDFGLRSLSETGLPAANDNDMLARAQFKAGLYAYPVGRVRSMTMDRGEDENAFYETALGTWIWDRVAYRQRLTNSAMWEQDSIVEGIQRSYDGQSNRLRVTLNLSSLPASLSVGGYWILNTSELNVSTALAY